MEYGVTVSQIADRLNLSWDSVKGILKRSNVPFISMSIEDYKKTYNIDSMRGIKPYVYHTEKANAIIKDILERRQIANNPNGTKTYDVIKDIKASRHLYYSMEELKDIFQKSQTYIMTYIKMSNVRSLKPDNESKVYYMKEDVNTKVVDNMIKFSTRREYTVRLHEIKKMLNG